MTVATHSLAAPVASRILATWPANFWLTAVKSAGGFQVLEYR